MVEVKYDRPVPVRRNRRRMPNLPWTTIGVGGNFFLPSGSAPKVSTAISKQRHAQPLKVFVWEHDSEVVDGVSVSGIRVYRDNDRTREDAVAWFRKRGLADEDFMWKFGGGGGGGGVDEMQKRE
ncbi:hypothetical protein [Breoghania sp.]|uniref:hypothetical protein n=1 Tax=Breoghania sp. TaxID=2065378 RepID=UPI002AA7EDDB|nr:hypothetical protein [Breoghania sp.]